MVSKTSDSLTHSLKREREGQSVHCCPAGGGGGGGSGGQLVVFLGESFSLQVVSWFHTEMQGSCKVSTGHCDFCNTTSNVMIREDQL